MVVQALTADKLQATHEEAAASAGEAGVLRICVLGQTRVAVTMPATFAAVLRLPFQTKPESPYDVMTMMVCSLHFQNGCKLPYPSVVRYTCVMYATCASLALPSASEPVMHGRMDVDVRNIVWCICLSITIHISLPCIGEPLPCVKIRPCDLHSGPPSRGPT